MKIDAWLDIACPFCYIGLVNFTKGLEDYTEDVPLDIEYKSFQLERTMRAQPKGTLVEYLAAKNEQSLEDTKEMMKDVVMRAQEAGIEINIDKVVPVNTLDAHRVVKYAENEDKVVDTLKALFKAYFRDGVNVADHSSLIKVAGEIGLDTQAVEEMLAGNLYKMEAISDQNLARDMGIQGVPFLALNMQYAVAGARTPEGYLDAIKESQSK